MERKRPPQKRGERRRQLLIDTTYKMLRDKGSDQFGYPDVAKRASIPLSSCYHFYGSKDDLLVAVAVEKIWPLWRQVATELESAEVTPRWLDLVTMVLQSAQDKFEEHAGASVLAFANVTIGKGYEERFIDTAAIASSITKKVNQAYQVPEYLRLEWSINNALIVWVALMRSAYIRPGVFEKEGADMAKDAAVAYLNTTLPTIMEVASGNADLATVEESLAIV